MSLHGATTYYAYNYNPEELWALAEGVTNFHDQGLWVYAFFNNGVEGHTVGNALGLVELLGVAKAPNGA